MKQFAAEIPDKVGIRAHFDHQAAERDRWIAKNRFYHDGVRDIIARHIEPGSSILLIGSATGNLLAQLQAQPQRSLGVDIAPSMVDVARGKFPDYTFEVADVENLRLDDAAGNPRRFDAIVLSDVVGYLSDVQTTLRDLRRFVEPGGQIVVTYYNLLWEPILVAGEKLRVKMPQKTQNWLSMHDIETMLRLSEWKIEDKGSALAVPIDVPFAKAFNRFASNNALLRHLGLVQYFCARYEPAPVAAAKKAAQATVSVIVPCRNERGNIANGIKRIPQLGAHTEIIFVDGNSDDGTVEEIESEIQRWQGVKDIRLIHQVTNTADPDETSTIGKGLMLKLGKGDAVRKGFAAATGDILMILDSDLTVAPEELPKFVFPLTEGYADFVNGGRLVYPMEGDAMRFLNLIGNKIFGLVFSWLIDQPVKDTLCGTKALFKRDYERIAANRAYFGDFDPFGDFDLLFGAARLGLRIVDMPIRYRARTAGSSKVTIFKHGILLLRMTWIGFIRLKIQRSASA